MISTDWTSQLNEICISYSRLFTHTGVDYILRNNIDSHEGFVFQLCADMSMDLQQAARRTIFSQAKNIPTKFLQKAYIHIQQRNKDQQIEYAVEEVYFDLIRRTNPYIDVLPTSFNDS